MKFEILKDFPGSQDGTRTEQFIAGTIVELSDYLASCIQPDWARRVPDENPVEIEIKNKAIVSDGGKMRRGKK